MGKISNVTRMYDLYIVDGFYKSMDSARMLYLLEQEMIPYYERHRRKERLQVLYKLAVELHSKLTPEPVEQ